MKFDKVDLIGHSFGGFVTARYAMKYPEYIRKYLLMSPLGVILKPDEEAMNKRLEKEPFSIRF